MPTGFLIPFIDHCNQTKSRLKRENFKSGARWEDIVGYSRAVKIGNLIEVSGTTSVKNGEVVHKNDAYLQAKEIISIASEYIQKAGGSLADVIRTRTYVTNIDDWEDVGKAHGEAFKGIMPATTLVEVSKLVDPHMLVEIEFTAYLRD